MAAVTLYREFILDGGYYPIGGIEILPNVLTKSFIEFGGKIIFNHLVKQINVENNSAKGIMLESGDTIFSKYVVSNVDAVQTFSKLIDKKFLYYDQNLVEKIASRRPSNSMLIVYLGINRNLKSELTNCCALWYVPSYSFKEDYFDITHNCSVKNGPVFCTIPSLFEETLAPIGSESVRLMVSASFKSKNYWIKNKPRLADIMIKRAEKIIPNLSKFIEIQAIASPQTLYRYTLNNKGAVYGWASIPLQSQDNLSYKTFLNNLFLCGHWVSFFGVQGGVSMVALVGYNVSKYIIKNWNT